MAEQQTSRGASTDDVGRAAAIDELHWHLQAHRLTQAEHDLRVERAHRAATKADLAMLFADLPRRSTLPPGTAYTDRVERARRRRWAAYRAVAISLVFAVVSWLAMGAATGGWSWVWLFLLVPVVTAVVQRENLVAKPAQAPSVRRTA